MSPEDIGNGNGVNSEGDVVPIDDSGIEEEASVASRRLVGEDIATVAFKATAGPEYERHYPVTAEDIIARRKHAAAANPVQPERYNAYAELGGGLDQSEEPHLPLENVLDDDYEPWQKDIRLAVEQFGLVEFSADELKKMKVADFMRFSLYFYSYLEDIDTNIKQIDEVDGDASLSSNLNTIYNRQSQEKLQKYRRTLEWLKKDLEATGVPAAVRERLNVPEVPTDGGAQRRRLLREIRLIERASRKGNTIRIVAVNGKPAIERGTI